MSVNPLELLKDAVTNSKVIKKVNDFIVVDQYRFPKETQCGYMSKQDALYTVGSLWYMLECTVFSKDKPYKLRTCIEAGFQFVSVTERNELIQYLSGKETSAQLAEDPPMFELREDSKVESDDLIPSRKRPNISSEDDHFSQIIVKGEKKLRTSQHILQCDFDVRIAAEAIQLARAELSGVAQAGALPLKGLVDDRNAASSLLSELKQLGVMPTIVVPCASQAVVNIQNVKDLLVNGKWTMPSTDRWLHRPRVVEFTKSIGGEELTFRVVDSTAKFDKKDWKSCVAVVVDGKEWQFRGWPFQSFGQLFNAIKGFYINMDNLPSHANSAKWSVQRMLVKRNTRHQDPGLAREFWSVLENFMTQKRRREFSNEAIIV